jgi:hypothetical protein
MMGEFSAGKSTLSNLLIGQDAIPMRVTATHLPPVWMAWGDEAPYREDLDGNRHPIEGPSLDGVPVEDTAFIRLFVKAEALELCDLIDTPGISDPNMPPEVWQRAAAEADAVIWLTHATQAWRQTEAAVWTSLPESLWPNSLLLLTRIDKILTERDRMRVVMRVKKETDGLFRAILPISLTEATAAGDDLGKWQASGGEAFSDALLDIITDVQRGLHRSDNGIALRSRPVFFADDADDPPLPGPEARAQAEAPRIVTPANPTRRVSLRVHPEDREVATEGLRPPTDKTRQVSLRVNPAAPMVEDIEGLAPAAGAIDALWSEPKPVAEEPADPPLRLHPAPRAAEPLHLASATPEADTDADARLAALRAEPVALRVIHSAPPEVEDGEDEDDDGPAPMPRRVQRQGGGGLPTARPGRPRG